MRKLLLGAGLGLLIVAAGPPAPAAAHGLGGRLDLPVPTWLFVYGAATVVIVSFVTLGILWRRPMLEQGAGSRPLPRSVQGILTNRAVELAVRSVSVAVFAVVLAAAAGGEPGVTDNLAPVFVYVWVWVGLAFVHALFGNWWATLSPWDSVARFLGIGDRPRRPYPLSWGKWPAALLLLGFVWMELVAADGSSPRTLAVAIAVYTVVTLAGMAMFGREAWNGNGEAFAVYFGLLSLLAPFARDREGRVVLRPPLAGLPRLRPQPGLVPFVVVLIGSTSFDGLTGTTFWLDLTGTASGLPLMLIGTGGLVAVIGLVALAYSISMLAASSIAGTPWHPLSVRFVHSLVPISFAYVVAHYFSLLVLEGQLGVRLLSDPLGRGWDLFGTRGSAVNLALLSTAAIWYVQVAAIVVGHVAGVVLAHDRSVAAFPGRLATRTQYALLGVMVLFTVGGLVILSGG